MQKWAGDYDGISLLISLTGVIREEQGLEAATHYLAEALTRRPSVKGLDYLIELKLEGGPETESGDEILRAVAQKLLARQAFLPLYTLWLCRPQSSLAMPQLQKLEYYANHSRCSGRINREPDCRGMACRL